MKGKERIGWGAVVPRQTLDPPLAGEREEGEREER